METVKHITQYLQSILAAGYGGVPWWEIVLLSAGVLAILTLLLGLFFNLGDHTKYRWASDLPGVASHEFLTALSRLSGTVVEEGAAVTVLSNGNEFLPALLSAIYESKHSVNLTSYIWEDGSMSDAVLLALQDRLRAGVAVRLLLDGFGGVLAPKSKLAELEELGAKIQRFRTPQLGRLTRLHRRNHRRALVMDGSVGFTGGMAIGDKWLGDARNEREWRDMMFLVTGNMAAGLQGAFASLWAATCGEILVGDAYYPKNSAGKAQNKFISLASSPASDTQVLPKFFWLSLASAKHSIFLTSPYVVPDKHVRRALVERARAGLDVRLLLPNHLTDAKPIRLASHFYYQEFLNAGVKIYEYQPTMMHSKALVVDGAWVVVGSANMDRRSKELNEENVLGVLDAGLGGQMQRIFFADLQKAKEVTATFWQKRSRLSRFAEALCVNFVKQY